LFFLVILPLVSSLFISGTSFGQDDDGTADLEQAFQEKIDATSSRDLDKVVKLCESAIKKGLDEGSLEQAQQLASSVLFQQAEQLGAKIFSTGAQDPRWRVYRSQALSKLKKAVKYSPKMGEAFLLTAKLNALPGGDKKQSKLAVEKAVELAGDDREQLSAALFYRATLAEDDEAQLADLNQAIKINPKNMDAIRVRAAYYFRQQEPEKAMQDLNKWLESDEPNADNYIQVAQQLMMTGDKFDDAMQKEAIRILDKAIEIAPKNPATLTMRARVNMISENLEEAVKDTSRAIELDKNNLEALLLRGSILSELERYDEALADINKAIRLQPTFGAFQLRSMIYSQQQDFEKAIADIALLLNSDPENSLFLRQLAILFNANDEPSKAIKLYEKLLKQDPKGSWETKAAAEKIGIMQRRAASLRGLGDAHLSTGEHGKAVKDFQEALALGVEIRDLEVEEEAEEPIPLDDGVLNNLAWVLATSPDDSVRDGKLAVQYATQAAELTEFKEAHILSTLASGYAEVGDFENATKYIQDAIELNKVAGEEAVDKTRTDSQRESLGKEYESYKQKKPWRELQDVEKEKEDSKAESDPEDKTEDKTEDKKGSR
jgi:tetratricopeptide (TPR) repeat protein